MLLNCVYDRKLGKWVCKVCLSTATSTATRDTAKPVYCAIQYLRLTVSLGQERVVYRSQQDGRVEALPGGTLAP